MAKNPLASVNMTGVPSTDAASLADKMATGVVPEGVKSDVVLTPEDSRQLIAEDAGDAGSIAGATTQRANATTARQPTATDANTYQATTTEQGVGQIADQTQAAQGQVSDQAQVQAQTMDPRTTAVAGAQAEQIDQAQQVQAPAPLTVGAGELVDGSAVDMTAVDRLAQQTQASAAQGMVSEEGTVQGQLANLMQDFEGGQTPPWAAGAMRAATAAMAARGLGSSSMAGQAIIQAAMESALPIAQADAQTIASFEAQNLSNRQQTAMLAAEQRAKFMQVDFDQKFQAKVQNAARIADVADMNFNAEQQIALENARLAQSVDLANLTNRQATLMAELAQIASLESQNLTNRQAAAQQNAQAFLQMDMANLDNQQQTTLFKAQQKVQALFNDQAAENAAKQFNATSQNQTDQFFAQLKTNVDKFNAEQKNAIAQFNAGEANAINKFNKELQNSREQFNAQNKLIIEQANAQWFRDVATADTAAKNFANIKNAENALALTETAFNAMYQERRDIMEQAWQSGENDLDRINELVRAKISADASLAVADKAEDAATAESIGGWISDLLDF